MTKVYIASNNLPVEIIRFHTIYDDFSDKVDLKLDNNNVFIADRSCRTMVVSTSQLHYYYVARKVGTSANSALIRYYLPRLKLSTSNLALARDRTPSTIIIIFHVLPL